MLFKIHYFVFNAGLSGVLPLITVFLRKYSDASSTEVGALLMILPFLSVLAKPFFCALADRHRRYRLYFALAILITLIGFGAFPLLPLFPELLSSSDGDGRIAWYFLLTFTVIGYIAYGVVWSLGDAYAANVAYKTGQSFGLIRLWGTVGWGVAGALVAIISPLLSLPEMVLGFLVFIVSHVFLVLLIAVWPKNEDFEMGEALPSHGEDGNAQPEVLKTPPVLTDQPVTPIDQTKSDLEAADQVLAEISLGGSFHFRRTPSNRLAISARLEPASGNAKGLSQLFDMANNNNEKSAQLEADRDLERKHIANLQGTIFRLVARQHKSIFKYLLLYSLMGAIFNMHWSYFFLHLERLSREGQGGDFSALVGLCLVAQAIGETYCFVQAPRVVKALGRDGAISLNLATYVLRYLGNGLGIPMFSPLVAVFTESLQGINYGIFYYLLSDTALHFALCVDDAIPELRKAALIGPHTDLALVRTSLRATMQGVFSAAFDGLGFGLGSLAAGILLESHSYEQLWCIGGVVSASLWLLHGLYELCLAGNGKRRPNLAGSGSSDGADLEQRATKKLQQAQQDMV